MVSTDCLQIIKFDESYYPVAFDSKLVRPFDKGGTFYLAINGLGRPRSNSKNKSAQKARRKLEQLNKIFSGSFLVNLYSEEPIWIAHMFG